MPYAPEHKEQTRARIVECARRMFNRHGFEAVSIDQIMASAGLTRGGFYHHFANKEALYAARRSRAMRACEAPCQWISPHPRARSLQMIGAYLSHHHLESLDNHCPMIALPSDVARAGPVVRRTYQRLLAGMAAMFERGIEPADRDTRQARWPSRRCASAAWCWRARSRTPISPPRSARRHAPWRSTSPGSTARRPPPEPGYDAR